MINAAARCSSPLRGGPTSERARAVLVLEEGEFIVLEDVKEVLLSEGLSRVFLPERVEVVEGLPKTMSGKVRKVELREMFAEAAGTR